MIPIEKIKEYIRCPQFGDLEYGKWGALKFEQRLAYRYLIDIIEGLEEENEFLKQLVANNTQYTYGIRSGSGDKE